jgi:hypothetical protein
MANEFTQPARIDRTDLLDEHPRGFAGDVNLGTKRCRTGAD